MVGYSDYDFERHHDGERRDQVIQTLLVSLVMLPRRRVVQTYSNEVASVVLSLAVKRLLRVDY